MSFVYVIQSMVSKTLQRRITVRLKLWISVFYIAHYAYGSALETTFCMRCKKYPKDMNYYWAAAAIYSPSTLEMFESSMHKSSHFEIHTKIAIGQQLHNNIIY